MGVSLYPHQEEFIAKALPTLHGTGGIYAIHDPGMGKTLEGILLAHKLKVKRALIVAPVIALGVWEGQLEQWLGASSTILREDAWSALRGNASSFLLTNYDQLVGPTGKRRLERLLRCNFDMLVLDEGQYCFPYDTEILTDRGSMPVGEVVEKQLPVSVLSCDLSRNVLSWQPITSWMKRTYRGNMVRIRHEHGIITCTANHRIWTDRGYIPASDLQIGENLQVVWQAIHTERSCQDTQVLRKQLCCPMENGSAKAERSSSIDCQKDGSIKSGKETPRSSRTDAYQQPDDESRNPGEDEIQTPRTDLPIPWGQAESHRPSADAGECPEPTDELPDTYLTCTRSISTPTTLVRSGYSRSGEEGSYRSGWSLSSDEALEVPGCSKDRNTICSRVESVEVYQPRNPTKLWTGRDNSTSVYNIEVANNHNYFAEGVLVSNCKNPAAQRTKAARKLGSLAEYRLFLSGTPQNDPLDWWSPLSMLAPQDPYWQQSFKDYRSKVAILGGPNSNWVIGFNPIEKERALSAMDPYVHTATWDDYRAGRWPSSRLPKEPITTVVPITLSKAERDAYRQMETQLSVEIGGIEHMTATIALTKLLRLCQITAGHLEETASIPSSKMRAVVEMIELRPRHKIVVGCRFKWEMRRLANHMKLKNRPYLVIDGDTPQAARSQIERTFQTSSQPFVLILQYKAGGMALTLTAVQTIIPYSLDPSYISWRQFLGRSDRIGQDHIVEIQVPLAENTYDTVVYGALQSKASDFDVARLLVSSLRR